MNEKKKIHITINPVAGHAGDYVAHFRSEFLDATFSVFFRDTITGALVLNSFSEMIRKKAGLRTGVAAPRPEEIQAPRAQQRPNIHVGSVVAH